ncbi:MAG: autoinducer binding domain-containing protein [Pseudomonadota bacterium]
MFTIKAFLKALDKVDDIADLQTCSEDLRDGLQVAHVVYHWVSAAGQQRGCGTYSPAWVQRYLEKDYLRIDPVILGCYQRFHPVDWKRLDWSTKPARAFQKEAIEYGVGNQGFSVPIRGPHGQFALFTISDNASDTDWALFSDQHQRDLILIAHGFNQKALEFDGGKQPQTHKALSPREADAMTLLAVGYSRAQVAQALSISEHTLRAYIESARFKLGASNTIHAVARAMRQGAIVI